MQVTLTESAAQDALFAGVRTEFWPFHWHGDVFSLPRQAVGLASSRQTPYQAFRYGKNAYGMLFHLEVTQEQISQMLLDFADELHEAAGDSRRDYGANSPASAGLAGNCRRRIWALGVDVGMKKLGVRS